MASAQDPASEVQMLEALSSPRVWEVERMLQRPLSPNEALQGPHGKKATALEYYACFGLFLVVLCFVFCVLGVFCME